MTFRACSSPAPTRVKPQPVPAILSQELVHTTLSITHHTRKRPSTSPRTTHGPHQRTFTMTPNPKTRLVTLPEVIMGTLAGKFAKFFSTTNTPTSSLDPSPTRTRHPPGSSHVSRLLSHRVRMPHSTSTSRMVSATLAGPMRKLSSHAGSTRRSSLTTLRTPTPLSATTWTPHTSLTSGQTLSSLNPSSP
jgi:hypothetical protein